MVPSMECRVPAMGCRIASMGIRVPNTECRVPTMQCRAITVGGQIPATGLRTSSVGGRVLTMGTSHGNNGRTHGMQHTMYYGHGGRLRRKGLEDVSQKQALESMKGTCFSRWESRMEGC